MQGQKELKKVRREVEEEFARVLGRRVPDGVVDIVLRNLIESPKGGCSSDDIVQAVRYTLACGLDCLQTVLRTAKSF
ncbi:MAG: hypothetical protein AB1700_04155 [Bacillota bacterium]